MDNPNSGFPILHPIPQAGQKMADLHAVLFNNCFRRNWFWLLRLSGIGAAFLTFFTGFLVWTGFAVCAETPTANKLVINNTGIFIMLFRKIYNKRSIYKNTTIRNILIIIISKYQKLFHPVMVSLFIFNGK
jgi:hypothetical protein